MKHASPAALDALDSLFAEILMREGVKDRGRGHFYRNGKALAHFHEDPSGLYADLHMGRVWRRLRVSEPDERDRFLAALDDAIPTG